MADAGASSTHTILTARWLLPIERPPIPHGWIEIADGRIVALGSGRPPGHARVLGEVALLPGLVNAHTHVELSWMEGRVPPADCFSEWVGQVIRQRAATSPADGPLIAAAASRAAETMRATGTVAVGDVSNTLVSVEPLRAAGIGGVVFHEVIGFNAADPAGLVRSAWDRLDALPPPVVVAPDAERTAGYDAAGAAASSPLPLATCVSAHAPYSVAPTVFAEIVRQHRSGPLCVHAAESAEELEFLRTGGGPLRRLLESLRAWDPAWEPPRVTPTEYLARLGYLAQDSMIVHGVQCDDAALVRIRDAGATLVTCPRSNTWVGAGLPNIARAYALGVPVAIGTDSLASTPSLNLFDELAEIRRIAPEVAAASLLESATRIGAMALGLDREIGTLEPGRRAALVAVDVPAGTSDVEEYLVGGVPTDAIHALWF